MEDSVKRGIIKDLTKKYYEAIHSMELSIATTIHDEITRWERELRTVEKEVLQPEIKFDGNTAIIPDEVKKQINRRFKGLCTYPEGCDKPIMSKGLCRMHYTRARKLRLAQ